MISVRHHRNPGLVRFGDQIEELAFDADCGVPRVVAQLGDTVQVSFDLAFTGHQSSHFATHAF